MQPMLPMASQEKGSFISIIRHVKYIIRKRVRSLRKNTNALAESTSLVCTCLYLGRQRGREREREIFIYLSVVKGYALYTMDNVVRPNAFQHPIYNVLMSFTDVRY